MIVVQSFRKPTILKCKGANRADGAKLKIEKFPIDGIFRANYEGYNAKISLLYIKILQVIVIYFFSKDEKVRHLLGSQPSTKIYMKITFGEGTTENDDIIRSGYSSRIFEINRVPIPEPVPPPSEWVNWKP